MHLDLTGEKFFTRLEKPGFLLHRQALSPGKRYRANLPTAAAIDARSPADGLQDAPDPETH